MRYIFVLIFALMLVSCSSKDVGPNGDDNKSKSIEIYDLVNVPQDVSYYTKSIKDNVNLYEIQTGFEERYFSPWNISKPTETLEDIVWPFSSYRYGDSYGENLQLIEKDFFEHMYKYSNLDTFATVNKHAVTLKHVNIRSFPTSKPLLKDPSVAGEGFPFDYLQNTSIAANKPILVSHYSKDKEWAYVFSSFANGWIKSSDMVFLKKKHTRKWQKAQQIYITKENVPVVNKKGDFLFRTRIGMMFALISEHKNSYTVLAVSKYKNDQPLFEKVKISKDISSKNILTLNKKNLEVIIGEVSKSNYGWGGLYEQRDCSSTLRDIFAPFGIWLPRNSSQQAKIGTRVNLEDLSDIQKIELIKDKAIPFQTFLYKNGHILLYVGTYKGEIIAFHNTWGIKTSKDGVDGRVVVGKAVFSTLRLGKYQENYDEEAGLLRGLKSMNIITM